MTKKEKIELYDGLLTQNKMTAKEHKLLTSFVNLANPTKESEEIERKLQVMLLVRNGMVVDDCSDCDGSGTYDSKTCPNCNGSGIIC